MTEVAKWIKGNENYNGKYIFNSAANCLKNQFNKYYEKNKCHIIGIKLYRFKLQFKLLLKRVANCLFIFY